MDERDWIVVKEGFPLIFGASAALIILLVSGIWPGAVLFLVITFFIAWFFRNPEREAPAIEGAAVSAADGKVVELRRVGDIPFFKGEATKISVFMSIFDVHVNRVPIGGIITDIRYGRGSFLPADRPEASDRNEHNAVIIRTEDGREVACVQVAGIVARRIVCWRKHGQPVERGERLGLIRFGSRVDCYFPDPFEVDVRVGQKVKAGQSILGYMP